MRFRLKEIFPSISAWAVTVISLTASSTARPPGELPGEEITDEQYMEHVVPTDSIQKKVPLLSPSSPHWLDTAAKTWQAPPLAKQMAQDEKKLLLGMGAVFVPRMADVGNEPDIEVRGENEVVVERGEPGTKINLLPGNYSVVIGSGAHQQRIVKEVQVRENKVHPVVPTWASLTIEVVDRDNTQFRGEYELARIDEFQPYGRGYGRNPDLGEELRTWILPPGTYKIFGVGESYNTLTHFVTVRLLPGEHTPFLLVQNNETDMSIIGGGPVEVQPDLSLASNWKYGVDLGSNIRFNAVTDHREKETDISLPLSLLLRSRLVFENDFSEWRSRFLMTEDFVVSGLGLSYIDPSTDKIRLTSMYVWRFNELFGPYGRMEATSEILPRYERHPDDVDDHTFIYLNEDSSFITYSDEAQYVQTKASFSPFSFESGLGVNIAAPRTRYFDARFLAGVGVSSLRRWSGSEILEDSTLDAHYDSLFDNPTSLKMVRNLPNTTTRPEYGPESAMYMTLRLGSVATIETEMKLFFPVQRFGNGFAPDLNGLLTMSWHVFKAFSLDYSYEFDQYWPDDPTLRRRESSHRVQLRFSIVSR